jgi:hypothetical protein
LYSITAELILLVALLIETVYKKKNDVCCIAVWGGVATV